MLKHLRLESKSPNKSLIEFIVPQSFRMVCKASRNMANFDAPANRYKTPSVAQKVGPMLEKVCDIILTESIERQEIILRQKLMLLKSSMILTGLKRFRPMQVKL